jgi:hypothetical protein
VPFTPCELHIPMVNTSAKVLVAYSIVSPMIPGQEAPTIHGKQIPPGYYSVGVDRVVDECKKLALEFEGGNREKTLGQAEHSCIIWRKCYIIIPNPAKRAPSPPPQLAQDRCRLKLMK